jgi:hypothetical protein
MDLGKLKGIADWPVPWNPTEVQQFLGFIGYYQYFVPNYSKIAWPLLDLTKKNLLWQWGWPQHDAFEELKTRMCCSPVLTQPNFKEKFYLQTDASTYSMGTILLQKRKNSVSLQKHAKPKTHPIAYYSAMFTPTEWNYDIYEQELLVIMKSLAHWQPYLGWTKEPFTILTDHANLQYWKAPRNLNQRIARWHADLQEYNYEIQHVPGKANVPANVLSRPPGVDQREKDNWQVTILAPHHFINATTVEEGPSKDQKKALILLTHDHVTVGHPGHDEMIRKVKKLRQWQGMNKWITDYVKGCTTCQQNKIITHWIKTLLYRITMKEGTLPFKQVTMDLIMGLPKHNGKDAILTIIDHGCS